MRNRVYATVGRPSVPSVRPIRSPYSAAAGLLLWARRPADVDRLLHGRAAERRASANGGSVALSAEAERRLVIFLMRVTFTHLTLNDLCSLAVEYDEQTLIWHQS